VESKIKYTKRLQKLIHEIAKLALNTNNQSIKDSINSGQKQLGLILGYLTSLSTTYQLYWRVLLLELSSQLQL
jgi:hypothetical protein